MAKQGRMIVFDMDGVLVDVKASYRETIRHTVHAFTGQWVSHEKIQDYKNAGGWNNDWALSQKICADLGTEVAYETVIERFNGFFLGQNNDGLILREQWIAQPGLLERLSERFGLAIFTGRLGWEAQLTLDRFAKNLTFAPLMGADAVTEQKPHPEGLLKIMAAHPGQEFWYVGDTVDDARSAQGAKVPFIGIVHAGNTRYDETVKQLREHGAIAILESINELEQVLPQ